jgi:hypothetical protein
MILPISASQGAKITGMSHGCPSRIQFYYKESFLSNEFLNRKKNNKEAV